MPDLRRRRGGALDASGCGVVDLPALDVPRPRRGEVFFVENAELAIDGRPHPQVGEVPEKRVLPVHPVIEVPAELVTPRAQQPTQFSVPVGPSFSRHGFATAKRRDDDANPAFESTRPPRISEEFRGIPNNSE